MRLRQLQSARPIVQLGAVGVLFAILSLAPDISFAEFEAVGPGAVQSTLVLGPPTYLDLGEFRRPRIRAQAAVIYNPRTHEVVWESKATELRSIASITKLMTALTFMDVDPDLTRDVVVSGDDVHRASTTYLRRGERVVLRDVLHLALIASDNVAARVLARVSAGGTEGFVRRMNKKASELGFRSTAFVDPSGLNRWNLSNAYEVSRLITYASKHPQIGAILRKSFHRMQSSRRRLTVRNTNRLLRGRLLVHGGKTGYIDASGYCLATLLDTPEGHTLAVVVLGVGSSSSRYRDVTRLVDWASKDGRSLVTRAESN